MPPIDPKLRFNLEILRPEEDVVFALVAIYVLVAAFALVVRLTAANRYGESAGFLHSRRKLVVCFEFQLY